MSAPSSRWASQAKINALLRYAPQREALANLTREAREQYEGSIRGARSAATLSSQAIEQAKPQVASIYDRSQASSSATTQQLASALAGLGSSANGFKAAAATQSAGGQEKTARERAAAEGSLTQQEVSAKEAPAFARTLANQQLAKSLSKIFASTQSIASGEGAATASELAKLEAQAEGRAVTERGQNLSHQDSVEGRAQKAREHQESLAQKRHEEGAGGKLLTRKEQNEGAAAIAQIRHFASEAGSTRAERVAVLTEGQPGQTGKNKKGESVKSPGVPSFKPDVLMSAALDWAEYGHLTTHTEHRLSQAGYDVARLGVPRSKTVAPGEIGKNVKRAIGF